MQYEFLSVHLGPSRELLDRLSDLFVWLFPEMDSRTIEKALLDTNTDINATLQKLSSLRLNNFPTEENKLPHPRQDPDRCSNSGAMHQSLSNRGLDLSIYFL